MRQPLPDEFAERLGTAKPVKNGHEGVYAAHAVYADFKELPGVSAFPVDAMPKGCRRLIREAAKSIGCPPEFVAVPMLAVLGSAIGNARVVRLKEGWDEGAGFYAAVIADPGEKKTPAYKEAIRPATKTQAALRDAFQKDLDEHARELREHEVDRRENAKNGLPAPPQPAAPVMGRTLVEDTTVEALAGVLEGNPRGVVAVRDELAAWVRSMDQYKAGGKGADRQFWLSAWSNSYVAVDRRSRPEPLILPRPFVGVFGSIQPGVLHELGGNREDGLLDRFLFAYPDPIPSRWTDHEVSAGARADYRDLYDGLRDKHVPEGDHGDPDPIPVRFAPDAKAVFVDAVDSHREETEAPGFPARLKGPWSKLEAYMARLSLILAVSRSVGNPEDAAERVEASDVLAAVVLLDYFKGMARRTYVGLHGDDPDDGLAEDLSAFLSDRGGRFEGTPAELHDRLDSAHKPRRPDELGKRIRTIAARTPSLEYEAGHEAAKVEGRRTTRRFVRLSLRNGVNSVNGVNASKGGV